VLDDQVKTYLSGKVDGISNVNYERIIISSIFSDPDSVGDIKEQLGIEDFTSTIHKNIMCIIYNLEDKYKDKGVSKINPDVIKIFASSNHLDIGGDDYLKVLSMIDKGDKDNISYYINMVKNLSIRRKGAYSGIGVIEDSVNVKEEDGDVYISRQEERFSDILVQAKGFDSIIKISDGVGDIMETRKANPRELAGIPTGFNVFDKTIDCLVPGTLTCINAFAKTGKSGLLTNWAVHIAHTQGIPVLYLDTEMTDGEFRDRVLSIIMARNGCIIPERSLTTGSYASRPGAEEAVKNAIEIMDSGSLYHLYMPEFNLEKVVNISRRFKRKYGVTYEGYEDLVLIIFDYIKLPDDTSLKASQEFQQLGFFTNGLKNKLAGRENIPVLTACQGNRSAIKAEESDPSQIGGSIRILQYVNTLCYLRNKLTNEIEKDGGWELSGNQVLQVDENSVRKGGVYKSCIKNYKPKGVILMEELMASM